MCSKQKEVKDLDREVQVEDQHVFLVTTGADIEGLNAGGSTGKV